MRSLLILSALTAALMARPDVRADDPAGKVPDDWAFKSLMRPALPTVQHREQIRNPIDAFLLARLEAAGLTFAPEADRLTLLRRVTFDLTGLPPTIEEQDGFLKDHRPDAYERVVDRLLASPRYGERWATYWLDLVRFAETDGFKADDRRPFAWRYRDYVIGALNADKPYDRFVQEQLAGDELAPDVPEAMAATGFLRHFPDEYNAVDLERRRQDILNDITDTVGTAFLGITVGCARCHDHKYDPITQEDYYRLQAFFAAYRPVDAPVIPKEQQEAYRKQLREWEARTADLRMRIDELERSAREKFASQRKKRFPPEYHAILDIPEEKRTPMQRQIVAMVLRQMQATPAEMAKELKSGAKEEWQRLEQELSKLERERPVGQGQLMGMSDVGPAAPPVFLLKRGDWRKHGDELTPGFPVVLDTREPEIKPTATTTGRRLALAKWLTRPENPLVSRTMVNRLWQHHFGRGLVATPADLGIQGERPSHPELLDWLATELPRRGWSLKQMHRLMVTSTAYRQSASSGQQAAGSDPENRRLSRMNRRRLEGEALRDSLLAVSGRLNPAMGGPGVFPEIPPGIKIAGSGWSVSADPAERARRSVYVFAKRNLRYPLFSLFDAPDGNEPCARRYVSTTAPQALTLLNDKLILGYARDFAARVRHEGGPSATDAALIDRAVRLAFGRPAEAEESAALEKFLKEQTALLRSRDAALVDLCHALVNVNEFLMVD